jgi:hypothetical protein
MFQLAADAEIGGAVSDEPEDLLDGARQEVDGDLLFSREGRISGGRRCEPAAALAATVTSCALPMRRRMRSSRSRSAKTSWQAGSIASPSLVRFTPRP